MEITCKTLEDTEKLAQKFALAVKDKGAFVSLYGQIGAGKTAFVKLVAKALNVKERVTSPSFVILNEYKSGKLPIYHFDLYRLENEGVKTILDELREYSEGKILTFVEWAEFSQDEIPFNHIKINVEYVDNCNLNSCQLIPPRPLRERVGVRGTVSRNSSEGYKHDARKYSFEAFGQENIKIIEGLK